MKKAAKSNRVGKAKGTVKLKKIKKELKPEGAKAKPRLDKFARGGAAKHKTQVNVIVGSPKSPMPMGAPPMGAPAMPPPPMVPAPGRPGMKSGGAVHMDAGAGGGLGRLEKAKLQKSKR